MSNDKKKFRVLAMVSTLLLLAGAISCKGFFVNSPDSLTISPDPVTFSDIGDSSPVQLTAQATFGSSTQDVTTSTTWKSANACAVVPSTTQIGQVTAIGTGSTVTITATYNGVSDTVSATTPSGLTITPCGTAGKFTSGGPAVTFTAKDGTNDVTSSATWVSDHPEIVHFASSASSTATFGPNTGVAIIKATANSTGELQITVQ